MTQQYCTYPTEFQIVGPMFSVLCVAITVRVFLFSILMSYCVLYRGHVCLEQAYIFSVNYTVRNYLEKQTCILLRIICTNQVV